LKVALSSIPIAMYFKVAPKGWSTSPLFVDLPFLHQMGYTALLTMAIIAFISYRQNKGADDEKGIAITKATFKTDAIYNISAFALLLILAALYAFFWS
jgi:SSS family solute:Na+ symporter